MSELYYTPPTQEIFDEVKKRAIEIWQTYDDTYGYASEKIAKIKEIENVSDNLMFIVAMFDPINQAKLAEKLSNDARFAIAERIINGGGNGYLFATKIAEVEL